MNSLILKYSVDLPDIKRLKKCQEDSQIEFLTFEDYNVIKNTNFKLSQLRTMCKHFKLRSSGNKRFEKFFV